MSAKNCILIDKDGNQILPATAAEQVSYDGKINIKQAIKNEITRNKTAPTAASMTNKEQIYVYTGTEDGYTFGNWYYWNGTAWTSGGIYNASEINTDRTLKKSGMAADAKIVGDEFDTVKVDLKNIYITNPETGVEYCGSIKIVNGKPIFEYDEITNNV